RARSGRRRESDLLGEREFSAGKNANCRRRVFGRGKSTRTGPEIACRQLVADSCSTRLNMVQAVVAHAEELLIATPQRPNLLKQRWCQCDQISAVRPDLEPFRPEARPRLEPVIENAFGGMPCLPTIRTIFLPKSCAAKFHATESSRTRGHWPSLTSCRGRPATLWSFRRRPCATFSTSRPMISHTW